MWHFERKGWEALHPCTAGSGGRGSPSTNHLHSRLTLPLHMPLCHCHPVLMPGHWPPPLSLVTSTYSSMETLWKHHGPALGGASLKGD